MSSDVPEGGTAPAPGRRPSRSSDGGAPVTGALTIVLAIVAVVMVGEVLSGWMRRLFQ